MLIPPVPSRGVPDAAVVPGQKRFTTRRASFPHAAWLGQGCPHCPISPTAASRRSLARVSVPVWGTVLSDPLPIADSVGRHPADYLMGRMPVPSRPKALPLQGCPKSGAWRITRRFHRLPAGTGWVAYALRTRPPLSPAPKDRIPSDLHVLGLPLAFILSQDQTLRCTIVLTSFLCLMGSALSCSLPDQPGPSRVGPAFLCWPQAFKEPANTPQPNPSPVVCGCKSTTFSPNRKHFFQLFFIINGNYLETNKKKFMQKQRKIMTPSKTPRKEQKNNKNTLQTFHKVHLIYYIYPPSNASAPKKHIFSRNPNAGIENPSDIPFGSRSPSHLR